MEESLNTVLQSLPESKLLAKIDKLQNTIKAFKKYDKERKEYYKNAMIKLGQLESELDEADPKGVYKKKLQNLRNLVNILQNKLKIKDVKELEDVNLLDALAKVKLYKERTEKLENTVNRLRKENRELICKLEKLRNETNKSII